jgi:cysteine desulfurase/selenocysteine lyase
MGNPASIDGVNRNRRKPLHGTAGQGMYARDFGAFDGRIWINAAHQGPLPRVAESAALEFLADRVSPHRITDESFVEVPQALRSSLGTLIGKPADEIILGNSATYGVSLLAAGISWKSGDEILTFRGDFPASVLPWRFAESFGARLRFIESATRLGPSLQDIASNLNDRTRVVALSWVNSFTGYALDVRGIAELCVKSGVRFVLNVSQGLGARVLDLSSPAPDAIVCCGHKWTLGPYGTGFCWIRPDWRAALRPPPPYWLPNVWGGRGEMTAYNVRDDLGARAFDVPGTANFLNFGTWCASIDYLLRVGLEAVARYDDLLVQRLLGAIPPDRYDVLSPREGPHRSTLVVVRPNDGRAAEAVHRTLIENRVDAAYREGAVRFAPHLYNTVDEIDYVGGVLSQ